MTTPPRSARLASRSRIATFGEGRVCGTAGCETQLSRYNDEQMCGVHGEAPPRHR